ncbi:enhancer of split m6 protein [Drosophila sulfurigaster albostrigata]|uniref:enhancer of split m6 protein n=1 Tax=Drosophila nasuta TaxID=42062 RepID=UPI00295EB0F2|nr:enhancer of split m6 protein [Drosophila nasuta]XP_062125024.1 enhancer of split m6 protein [Drosophila sulfurigaster albostrigata]
MSKVKNLIAKMLQRRSKCNSSGSIDSHNNNNNYCEEIAQNLANERMLQETTMATQQLLFCLETADGSFYWHAQ